MRGESTVQRRKRANKKKEKRVHMQDFFYKKNAIFFNGY